MNSWSNINTKYHKRRIKIFRQYILFNQIQNCNPNNPQLHPTLVSSAAFFSKQNIQDFIQQTKSEKRIIITHLSEGLKQISLNKINNFETYLRQSKATLKNIPSINDIIAATYNSKSKPKNSEKNEISAKQLADIYLHHQSFNHCHYGNNSHHCRILFLALTGLRIQSSINLKNNSKITQRKCKYT